MSVMCPCCGYRAKSFEPFGKGSRPNALCPQCGSLERQRAFWLYLKKHLPKYKPLNLLHFAPEPCLEKLLQTYSQINYITTDLTAADVTIRADITNLPFAKHTFDVIICSHVLEHVVDDQRGLSELHRILKPDGWAIIQVPIKLEKTYEDSSIQKPAERQKAFGQRDHVRVYGQDFFTRLKKAKFTASLVTWQTAWWQADYVTALDKEPIIIASPQDL